MPPVRTAPAGQRMSAPSPVFDGATLADMRIDIFDRMEPLEEDWRRLEADTLTSLHQSYDWCAAWVKTHREPPAIVCGSSSGTIQFILPLEIVRSNIVRIARFIAGPFSNINTGLFSPEFWQYASPQRIAALTTQRLAGRADVLALQNLPFSWRGARHPFAPLPAIRNQNSAFQLPLQPSFEATLTQLNAKRRRKRFRLQTRKLNAAGGYEHIIARTDAEKSDLIELFFRQKKARFQSLGLPDVFQAAETQAFFRTLLQADKSGRDVPLELHAIRLKGERAGHIPAIAGLSRKADHVICQFGSIDEAEVADASPGDLLFWLMIERCCAEGAVIFDFGIGDQLYKRSWCTVETVHHDVLLPVTPLGRVAVMVQRGVTRTKAAIKSNPQLYAIAQRLRRGELR